jgi:hypothetical protein
MKPADISGIVKREYVKDKINELAISNNKITSETYIGE